MVARRSKNAPIVSFSIAPKDKEAERVPLRSLVCEDFSLRLRLIFFHLHKNAKSILDIFKGQGLLSYRRIHVMPILRRGIPMVNPDQAGMEDLQIYLLHGKTLYRELKSLKGRQTPAQKRRQRELESIGHDYAIWRSVDDIVKDLRKQGLQLWCFPG
jgi:hypothetical protein